MQAIKINSDKIQGQLSVFVYEDKTYPQKNMWIAYCPELDLAGYDFGKEAAKKSLIYILTDYFDYTLQNGTLEKDLLSHGWHKYKNGKLIEPSYKNLIKSGRLNNVMSQSSYSKFSIPVEG